MTHIRIISFMILLSTTLTWSQENAPNPSDNLNWISNINYDLNGNTVSKGVGYFNTLGKATQNQSWDVLTESVWTSQTLYDFQGRPALQTLSAPTGSVFGHLSDFVRQPIGNGTYTTSNFDSNFTRENPLPVGNQESTLGWYYSEANTNEPYQDVTRYPFSRTIYSKLNPGVVLKTIGGNKVNVNGNEEWANGHSFTMPVSQELHYAFGTDEFTRVKVTEESCNSPSHISVNYDENLYYLYNIIEMDIDYCSTKGSTIYNAALDQDGDLEYEVNKIYKMHFYDPSTQSEFEGYYKIVNKTLSTNFNYTLDGYVMCGTFSSCSDAYVAADYIKATKTVVRDVHGVETVVFTDSDGNTLAAGRSGNEDGNAPTPYPLLSPIGEQGFVDIHIPVGCGGNINFEGNTSATYNIYDLITESQLNTNPIVATSPYFLNPGIYRVVEITEFHKNPLPYTQITNTGDYIELIDETNQVGVSYNVNYYDFSLNYYDKTGRLIKSVQPEGYDSSSLDLSTPTRDNDLISTFTYNTLGQLLSTTSPDEGTANFKYRKDGQIRFSQNSLQASNNEFSYTNYDNLGRPIESGVFSEGSVTFANSDNIIDNIDDPGTTGVDEDGLSNTSCSEVQFTTYDVLSSTDLSFLNGVNSSYANPSFLAGSVAKTSNDNTTTYYSYDMYGRVKWIVQDITGLTGAKTIDYEYGFATGAVTKVIYQKHNSADRFVHKYNYNVAGQLTSVETSTDNVNFTEQESYTYYETGALKRKELLGGIQGTDYVYNLNGQLKAINHPGLNASLDPGGDADDAFGILIDYHQNDYARGERSNITTSSFGTDQFNGNIKTTRWNTFTNALPTPKENTFNYQYNKNNWLVAANYGEFVAGNTTNTNLQADVLSAAVTTTSNTLTLEATNSITLQPGFHAQSGSNVTAKVYTLTSFNEQNNGDYNVSGITYDANGNIKTLKRNKNTENGSNAMDDFTYHYKTSAAKNQLDHVTDAVTTTTNADDLKSQTIGNYSYNSIGQLTQSNENGEVINYTYNASGLVTEIKKNSVTLVKFLYNDKGYRVKKQIYSPGGSLTDTDVYVRDASGSVMAIYRNSTLEEQPIYGASRIGVYRPADGSSMYQLTDHLGNVRAVIGKDTNNNMVMLSYTDYYPFGMPMPNRNVEGNYRYGYQGEFSEKEPELPGRNSFQLRLYDSRVGRWISPDPYGEFYSPYLAMGNNPASNVDPSGGCINKSGRECEYSVVTGEATDAAGHVWTKGSDGVAFSETAYASYGATVTAPAYQGYFVNNWGYYQPTDSPGAKGLPKGVDPNSYDVLHYKEDGGLYHSNAGGLLGQKLYKPEDESFAQGLQEVATPGPPGLKNGVSSILKAQAKKEVNKQIIKQWNKKINKQKHAKDRSPHPIGKRINFPSRKKAYESSKRAGNGNEPVLHYDGEHGPHYHPGDAKGKPLNHDHYYFPK